MKRSNIIGTILGAIAIALAVAGLTLSSVDAAPGKPGGDKDKDGQGVISAVLGF